jgi:hypothetical protein
MRRRDRRLAVFGHRGGGIVAVRGSDLDRSGL